MALSPEESLLPARSGGFGKWSQHEGLADVEVPPVFRHAGKGHRQRRPPHQRLNLFQQPRQDHLQPKQRTHTWLLTLTGL